MSDQLPLSRGEFEAEMVERDRRDRQRALRWEEQFDRLEGYQADLSGLIGNLIRGQRDLTTSWSAHVDAFTASWAAHTDAFARMRDSQMELADAMARVRDSQLELADAVELIDQDLATLHRAHVEHAINRERHIG